MLLGPDRVEHAGRPDADPLQRGLAELPDAAKIGTVEIDTPLLEDPLPGAVYIATPHDNPFDSLLALYVVVDDPITGVVIKLAGKVEAGGQQGVSGLAPGQLRATFDDNPQLPFGDFKLEFKSGPHAALRTPATCGPYSTASSLSPWSGTPPVSAPDNYSISQAPGGGTCATTQSALPHAPSFDAGTVSPLAGSYSPFVLNLRRNDGSQQFSTVTVTPPPGLVGKLAGTPACSDAAIDAASSRRASRSWPARAARPRARWES